MCTCMIKSLTSQASFPLFSSMSAATMLLSFPISNQRGQHRKCLKTNFCLKKTLEKKWLVLRLICTKTLIPYLSFQKDGAADRG